MMDGFDLTKDGRPLNSAKNSLNQVTATTTERLILLMFSLFKKKSSWFLVFNW
jgi:hypothetical protein